MSIPADFLDDLRMRVPTSDIVRRRVQLRKQGREWAGLSPFNKEKTPSFFVNDDKRFYHCFSSGKHGDVFTFLMEVEGHTFREAVETVAAIAGMDVPSEGPEADKHRHVLKSIADTIAIATDYFESQLRMPVGRDGLAYLKSRGLDDATIRRFRLGYAPSAYGSLAASLAADGITQDQLVDAGLMKRRDDGRAVDYFRDRVLFPIADRQGRIVGFGGRALGEAQPKYLNSPESAAFHKGSVLYGLASAREAAHKAKRVFVVEGYMDVIALAQAGIAEAVAPLGTALGEDQIRLLWTLAAEPILCLDGDRAGRAAAIRAAERALPLLKPGKSLRFAALPQGEDPDTLVRKEGTDAIDALAAQPSSLIDILWQSEWQRNDPSSPERRAAFHAAMLDHVRRIDDQTVRGYYEQEVMDRLQRTFAAQSSPLQMSAPRPSAGQRRYGRRPDRAMPVVPLKNRPNLTKLRSQREYTLLGLVCLYPEAAEATVERLAAIPLVDNALDSLRNQILSLIGTHEPLDGEALATQLRGCAVMSEESADTQRPVIEAVMEAGKAALLARGMGEESSAYEAITAVTELLESLEQAEIRKDVLRRASATDENADPLDRVTQIVAAEHARQAND